MIETDNRMEVYSLHEMTGLLKTGLWMGGEVSNLGYIGPAECRPSASGCGMLGVYISYDTMLEKCVPSPQGGGCELLLSQYRPYTGTFATYVLESNVADREVFLSRLIEVLADARAPYLWSHNITRRNIFGIERRYGGLSSGMWMGNIATPRRSRLFGR